MVSSVGVVCSVSVVTCAVSGVPAVSPPACSSSSSALTEASLFISLRSVIPATWCSLSPSPSSAQLRCVRSGLRGLSQGQPGPSLEAGCCCCSRVSSLPSLTSSQYAGPATTLHGDPSNETFTLLKLLITNYVRHLLLSIFFLKLKSASIRRIEFSLSTLMTPISFSSMHNRLVTYLL